jgi:uroporphyrinogen-III synthase
MRLIVTRPEPDATRTARALIRLGHEAILCPMLDIATDPGVPIPSRPYQAVAVTSSNAVRALAGRTDAAVSRDLPLFAVGDQTALEAKRAGFPNARSAGGAVDDLIEHLSGGLSPENGPILHAAGEAQAGDLAGRLKAQAFDVVTAIVYRAEPRPELSGVARDALRAGAVDGVLLYSKRSAEAFANALRAARLTPLAQSVTVFSLSEAASGPIAEITTGATAIAEEPNQISLFALIEAAARRRHSPDGAI